ncbi:MAG: SGNH/GDSL hydrolase family protein [Lachnospiraceae bacterium]|nr:SGNH/GDSL hydrolase family protein [Lachnospiraceae bacterium]
MTKDRSGKLIPVKFVPLICGILLGLVLILAAFLIVRGEGPAKRGYDVVIFGDSIMAYSQDETSVANMIASRTGLSVGDFSFGGTMAAYNAANGSLGSHKNYLCMAALSQALVSDDLSVQRNLYIADSATDYFYERVSELEALDLKATDIVIIEHCLNDYHSAIPIGDENSRNEYTYCGALRLAVENIRRVNPDIRIIFVSPTEKWMLDGTSASEYDYGGGVLDDYMDAQRRMAEVLNVEYVWMHDLYGEASDRFTDDLTGEPVIGSGYTVEGTHPNYYGRYVISERISDYLEGKYNDGK